MAFNPNEIILDRIRQASLYDLEDGSLRLRITSIEEPNLGCTAEGEEVLNAQGNLITTIYRAKQATFTGTNSLFSFDLAAEQFGTKKNVADADNMITNYAYEVFDVSGTTVTLKHAPQVESVKYIYSLVNGEIGTSYAVGAAASDTEFVIADTGEITLPTSVTSGKVYVEYAYSSESAVSVLNRASEYPTAGRLVILAYFRDKCTDKLYAGSIICPKAKLNPSSVELSLTPTGKHPFEFQMLRDVCDEVNDQLFEIVLTSDQ